MSVSQEDKPENKPEEKPKPMTFRRSSLKNRQPLKFDPNAIIKVKDKRNSVSWGKSNTFEFKAMKAMFKEGEDLNKKESKEDKEKHQEFLKNRKASIKNEFSLIKELMKKSPEAIIEEEENDEEAKKNMKKNFEIGKEALKEEDSESSKSKSNSGSDNESKSCSKSGSESKPKKNSKNVSKNETDDEKDTKKEKTNEDEKEEKKDKKESKLKNKKQFKDEENDINAENNEVKGTEKFSIKKNKKPKFAENEIKIKNNETEKEKEKGEDKQKENENKGEGKVRLMDLKDAQHLELEKIAYIVLTDGNIVIIKNQGENLVQDLLTIPNPLLKQNQIKNNQTPKPLQQKFLAKKGNEMQTNQKPLKQQNNIQENKYKNINNNIARNSSYNRGIGSQLTRKTYSITNSPNYPTPTTVNRSIEIPKSYYINQLSQKYPYSNKMPNISNIDNNNDYLKYSYSNNNLSQYKNQLKAQRNKSQEIYGTSKSVNYNQNKLPIHSNFLASQTNQYLYQNTRDIKPNYAESLKNKYIYKNQIQNTSRMNYINYLDPSRDFNCRSTPIEIIDTYNSSYNQANSQF